MRVRVLLLAVLALVVAGSATAASGKSRLHRVVVRHGDVTATLTYRMASGLARGPRLSVSRGGRIVLAHRLCPLEAPAGSGCAWGPFPWTFMKGSHVVFRNVAPAGPAAVVDLWEGGAHCCEQTFIAVAGAKPAWIAHDWGNPGYRGQRIGGRYDFVSADDRFNYTFGCYACSYAPLQVWTIDGANRLVDVTRSLPGLLAHDARRAWRGYLSARHDPTDRGLGVLAGWCADEYSLGAGNRCATKLRQLLALGRLDRVEKPSGQRYVDMLERDLRRWGYTAR